MKPSGSLLAAEHAEPDWLDDRQAAALLKVRRKRVHQLRADHTGSFPRARHREGGLVWSRDELLAWADAQGVTPSSKRLPRTRTSAGHHHELPRSLRLLLPLVSVLGVLAVSVLMYRQRLSDDVTNVDDYLYARQTAGYLDSLSDAGIVSAWREFGINSPLVPTLAMPISAVDSTPSSLVLVQLPLVVGLVIALGVLLRKLGMGPWRWPLAGLLAVAPPVLTYTAMLSFSIAATLGVVASLLAYLSSKRLRSRRAAIWLGVALGLLSLSRVVALVYLAALVLPMLVDLYKDRDDIEERVRNAGLTAGVAFVIAAPWWLTAGPKAMKYLLDAGYSSGSVFVSERPLLGKIQDRFTRTADETGWLLAIAVLVVFVVGVAAAGILVRRQQSEAGRGIVVGAGTCVLGMLFLGTSSNAGTAFALPYVVLMAALGTAGLALALHEQWLPVRALLTASKAAGLAVSTVAVLLPADPATWNGRALWLSGTPARTQFESALGCTTDCDLPEAGELNERIYAEIGTAPTLILRADAIVNPESLRFLGEDAEAPVRLVVSPTPILDPAQLETVSFVIAGRTAAPYLGADLADADAVLQQAGLCRVLNEQLSPSNEVTVWGRPFSANPCA